MNTILNAVEKWARETPEEIAFVGCDFNNAGEPLAMSYQTLQERIYETAHQLQAMDVTAIALRADNSLSWALVDLAAMYANVVVVPVPTFFSPPQVEHILNCSAYTSLGSLYSEIWPP